jgi:hypothetical protein
MEKFFLAVYDSYRLNVPVALQLEQLQDIALVMTEAMDVYTVGRILKQHANPNDDVQHAVVYVGRAHAMNCAKIFKELQLVTRLDLMIKKNHFN